MCLLTTASLSVLQKLCNTFGISEIKERKAWAGLLLGLGLLSSAFPFLFNARRSPVREPLDGGEELVIALLPGELHGGISNARHQPTQCPRRRASERRVTFKLTQ